MQGSGKAHGGRRLFGHASVVRQPIAIALVTGIAAGLLVMALHEPERPARKTENSKSLDRLTWEVEQVPTRMTRTYDTIATFARPIVEPSPWSESAAQPEPSRSLAAVRPAPGDRAGREPPRKLATLPPNRPTVIEPAVVPPPPSAVSPPAEERGLEVLGWRVPGTDKIQSVLPDGRAVVRGVTSLGDRISGAGETLAQTVGLR
ncbi:hypothetical protein [Enterovirga sp. CN4-39]|uniref:hypothetical protein n=1 Tax=Enterovirga sp. CN4-39 TaxID=3400910 RepID=UPI003C123D39